MSAAIINELSQFQKDIKKNEMFLKLEQKIKNPANPRCSARSETLLSAFVSLSCGRFERYLQKCFFHAADDLRQRIGSSLDARIVKVSKFHWQNLNGFIDWAAKAKGVDKTDLLIEIKEFSDAISAGNIYPKSFQYTHANPNCETLKRMFSRFGIEDALKKISNQYLDSMGRSFSSTLIESTLNGFVKRRHEAAHHGRIEGVTRVDVNEDRIFIQALAEAINKVVVSHLSTIN